MDGTFQEECEKLFMKDVQIRTSDKELLNGKIVNVGKDFVELYSFSSNGDVLWIYTLYFTNIIYVAVKPETLIKEK